MHNQNTSQDIEPKENCVNPPKPFRPNPSSHYHPLLSHKGNCFDL